MINIKLVITTVLIAAIAKCAMKSSPKAGRVVGKFGGEVSQQTYKVTGKVYKGLNPGKHILDKTEIMLCMHGLKWDFKISPHAISKIGLIIYKNDQNDSRGNPVYIPANRPILNEVLNFNPK